MTRTRSAASPAVALLARWDGFCLPCGSEQRPLVLTWAGRRGVRAWLSGDGFADGRLRLTCACCGGVDVVGWEDEPEQHPLGDAAAEPVHVETMPVQVKAMPVHVAAEPAHPAAEPLPLLPADAALPRPRQHRDVAVADVMAELAALHGGQVPSGPPVEAEPADLVTAPLAAPVVEASAALPENPLTTIDALLEGPPRPVEQPLDAALPQQPADARSWFAVHVAPEPRSWLSSTATDVTDATDETEHDLLRLVG